MSRTDKVIVVALVLGFMLALFVKVTNMEQPVKKCIDDRLYRLTDNGYWVAYSYKPSCKLVTIEEQSK
tara:strand:- start:325 stop:528 length:204 start_codon:yes stop_codon:yes gene_type:complete